MGKIGPVYLNIYFHICTYLLDITLYHGVINYTSDCLNTVQIQVKTWPMGKNPDAWRLTGSSLQNSKEIFQWTWGTLAWRADGAASQKEEG